MDFWNRYSLYKKYCFLFLLSRMKLSVCLASSVVKKTMASLLSEAERTEHLVPLLQNGWKHIQVIK